MPADTTQQDPAFPVMIMDILSNVLSRADSPVAMGTYLTEEIRELTGTRCVLLLQSLNQADGSLFRVVSINPERQRPMTESAAMRRFYGIANGLTEARIWRPEETSEGGACLRDLQMGPSMTIPLSVGAFRVGAMITFGLPEDARINDVLDLLKALSTIVALVLRNAFLFEEQESIIQERTSQLQTSNMALRNSEQNFREFILADPDPIQLLDADGTILICNQASASVMQAAITDLVGRHTVNGLPPEAAEVRRQRLNQVVSTKKSCVFEEQVGGRLYETQMTPITNEAGAVVKIAIFPHDITERKQAEEQHRQTQKMEAIGQLAGGVAHDFNNILAAVLLNLDLVQQEPDIPPARVEILAEIEKEVQRAASLTRQLLMFSRQQRMQLKPLDLNDTLDNLMKMLRRLLGEHIQIDFYSGSNLPLIESDAGMMDQLVMNLCVNARDAMPGGGTLTLRSDAVNIDAHYCQRNQEAREGKFVRLQVSDTGSGMDESTLKRIFEPFFTTKDVGKGTGLGLATVYGIVKQNQGWLEVMSAPGKGSTFSVFLPVLNQRMETQSPQPPQALRSGKESILLVEDEPSLRRSTAMVLRRAGYQVAEAANGLESRQVWERHQGQFDLLLSDMVMPKGVTGLELARQFQVINPKLKIILVSGYHADLNKLELSTSQTIHFLAKPYNFVTLGSALRQCLD